MDIEAMQSTLISLTLLSEEIRLARETLEAGGEDTRPALAQFLAGIERDVKIARAAFAQDLGFTACACCWPPELIPANSESRAIGAHFSAVDLPAATPSSSHKKRSGRTRKGRDAFLSLQKARLLELRDAALDSVSGALWQNRTSRPEDNGSSDVVKDGGDAGSDSYDRAFALTLLSQGHDAVREIDEALGRIDQGSYGICEASGKRIPRARLEAIPFARYTVACQAELEREHKFARAWQTPAPLSSFAEPSVGEDEQDWEPGRTTELAEQNLRVLSL